MPKTFTYQGKQYPWISSHPDNIRWEDGSYSCTPLQEQIEILKYLKDNHSFPHTPTREQPKGISITEHKPIPYHLMELTPESTWKQFSVALARKLMTLSHGFNNDQVKEESLKEALILTTHVWTKQRLEAVVLESTSDDEDRAADFLEENSEHNITDMNREDILITATKLGWERDPEPTDAELTNYGEPPITLDEMHTKAYKQHIQLHS